MSIGVQVVIDCADPPRLAEFCAAALGYKLQDPPPGFASWQAVLEANNVPESEWTAASAVVDPNGKGPRFFQRVPERLFDRHGRSRRQRVLRSLTAYQRLSWLSCTRLPQVSFRMAIVEAVTSVGGIVNSPPLPLMRS